MKPATTASAIKCFRQCPRMYNYKYEQGYRTVDKPLALSFGSLVHEGLEVFWLVGTVEAALLKMSVSEHYERLDEFTQQKAAAMVERYFERWESERPQWQIMQAEYEFSFDLDSHNVRGKQDAVARDIGTGCLYTVEHKTASRVDEDYFTPLAFDPQVSIYATALEQLYREPVKILYDVLSKPGIIPKKSRKKENKGEVIETPLEYRERCKAWLTDDKFHRREIAQSRDDRAQTMRDVSHAAFDILSHEYRPRNNNSCTMYGRACDYLGVCSGSETLQSERFEHSANPHPELTQTTKEKEANVSNTTEPDSLGCPL